MKTQHLGKFLRQRRKALKLRQADLALVSGTGLRFISDLENGKPTCEIGKVLGVIESLGIQLVFELRQEKP